MKKLISVFLWLGLISNASAGDFFDNTILGLAFINQSAGIEISNSSTSEISESFSESGSGFGLYLDKYYKRNYRFNGTLAYLSYTDFDITELMFSADYLIPINGSITFFSGLSLGGALQKYSSASITDSSLGGVYGAQLGGIAYINDNLMLELGYRYRAANIETEIANTNLVSTINDVSESYFSILLMF